MKSKASKRTTFMHSMLGALAIGFCIACNAQFVFLKEVHLVLRLKNYVLDNVVVWFSGSQCSNVSLLIPQNATKADRDRFFATVLIGKTTGQSVFVTYAVAAQTCSIESFGLDAQ